MTTLAIDDATAPRSYRIGGGGQDVLGGAILLAIFAVPLAWSAASYGPAILAMLAPRSDGDLSWLWWGLSQLLFASVVLVWSLFALVWALGAAALAAAALVPGSAVWRLDGAGLSCIGGVGPFTRTTASYYPFEAIAQIQHYKTEVMLHVWRGGVARYERTIAQDLPFDDAQRLAALLNEDLAAAAREWEAQGLRIDRTAVNRGR